MNRVIDYNKIYDGILEIKNFLSIDECKKIIKIIESFSEDSWQDDIYQNWNKRNLKFGITNKDLNIIKNKISIKTKNIFESFSMITPSNNYVNIQRILPNTGGLDEHKDNFTNTIKYGLVLYYNDDYLGGEIYYPEIGVSYKPSAGSLLIHDGSITHKVNEVFEKTRYMSTFFVHETNEIPALLKNLNH